MTPAPSARGRRAAFTILEMIVVMVALAIAMAVGTALIVATLKLSRVGTTAANRVAGRIALAERFRADVAAATDALDRWGDHVAGPTCLVLGTPVSLVVYRWDGTRLERHERVAGNDARSIAWAGPAGSAVEFVRGDGLVTLRLTEPSTAGPARRTDLAVAVGGDLR